MIPWGPVTGMPDDPELHRVAGLVRVVPEAHGELRFQSAFATPAAEASSAEELAEAERILLAARRRHPRDPRVRAAVGCYELAAARLERAERDYRGAIDQSGGYGEARLGLGVALADRAEGAGDEEAARGLRLAAIAQFAAVAERDPAYRPALFNRTLLLLRVGREPEARRWAARYAALDPGPWSDELADALGRASRSP